MKSKLALARPLSLVLAVLSPLAPRAVAEATNGPPRAMTLEQCLRLALVHNLDLQVERLAPQIARWTLASAYGAYDPVFSFSVHERFLTSPATFDPKKTGVDAEFETTTDTLAADLRGQLPTGLRYDVDASVSHLEARTFFDPLRRFAISTRDTNTYFARSGISLSQPVLRNLWVDAPRQTIRINRRNLRIAELAFRQELLNVVTQVELAYYGLIYDREQVKVQERALELARQLLAENRRRVQAGALAPLDEKQAESQVAATEAALFAVQQTYAERETRLKTLITDDLKTWADIPLEPADQLLSLPPVYERAESWQRALSQRPDLLQFRLAVEKGDLEVRYRFNQLFPEVDLTGSYGGRSVREGLTALKDDLLDFTYPHYSYGVILSVPVTSTAARHAYRASQAAKQQAELRLKRLEQLALAQVDDAGKLTLSTYARIGATRQARVFAEQALAQEQQKLSAGLTTSFVVLELQRNLTEARTAEVRALTDYYRARAQLAFSEGTSLEHNQLALEYH